MRMAALGSFLLQARCEASRFVLEIHTGGRGLWGHLLRAWMATEQQIQTNNHFRKRTKSHSCNWGHPEHISQMLWHGGLHQRLAWLPGEPTTPTTPTSTYTLQAVEHYQKLSFHALQKSITFDTVGHLITKRTSLCIPAKKKSTLPMFVLISFHFLQMFKIHHLVSLHLENMHVTFGHFSLKPSSLLTREPGRYGRQSEWVYMCHCQPQNPLQVPTASAERSTSTQQRLEQGSPNRSHSHCLKTAPNHRL